MKSVTAFWLNHQSVIIFTLKSWGTILILGTGFMLGFLKPTQNFSIWTSILSVSFCFSAPFVLVFCIIASRINNTNMMVQEKKHCLAIIGIILGFMLLEIFQANTMEFLSSVGYLVAIPAAIYAFKL